jgi:uncharacterized protein involved in exopolysaccharide biosynthesis
MTISRQSFIQQSDKEYRDAIDVDLNRYSSTLSRHWVPAASIFLSTLVLSALATTLIKPTYETTGRLLFKVPTFNLAGADLSNGGGTKDLTPLVQNQSPINTQVQVISSNVLLQKTIDKLQLKDAQGEPLKSESLAKSLKMKIVGGTDVLTIDYENKDPEEAAAVVNTLMELYLENDILVNRSDARATLKLIGKQLPLYSQAVQKAEVALSTFRQKYGVVDLTEEKRSAVTAIRNIDNQIDVAKSELGQVTAQTNELRNRVGLSAQDAIVASALSQSPTVKETMVQLKELERQIASAKGQFQNANPIIIELEAKKASLSNLLQQEVTQIAGPQGAAKLGLLEIGELKQTLISSFLQSEVQRSGMSQKLASLYSSRAVYEPRLRILPQLEQQQRDLERKLEVPQATYQNLLKKSEELQLAENDKKSSARIIARAEVPASPAAGKKALFLLLGGLSGIFLATSMLLFLARRDRRRVNNHSSSMQLVRSRRQDNYDFSEDLNLWEVSDLSTTDVSLMSSNELSKLINKELSGLAGDTGLGKSKRLGGRTD